MFYLLYGSFLLLFPAFIIWLCSKYDLLNKIGVVTCSFLFGLLLALSGVFNNVNSIAWQQTQTNVLDIAIALALPLLIISVDVRATYQLAKTLLWPMFLAMASVIVVTTILVFAANYWFENVWQESLWQYAGMAVGAYTGGGVNMAAIKTAINADEAIFIVMTSYDILLSALYLLVVLTIGVPLVRRFLSAHSIAQISTQMQTSLHSQSAIKQTALHQKIIHQSNENPTAYLTLLKPSNQKFNIASLLMAEFIVGVSVLLASFFSSAFQATITVVLISSLAVFASIFKKVNLLVNSYQLGMYLVLVFCLTVGSMFDVSILYTLNIHLFIFLLFLVFGSFFVHLLLCKLFKIDADRCLVTSVASIMSLPFMPLICSRLNNKQMLVAGIAVAIIGYILGTYLGITMAFVLMSLL